MAHCKKTNASLSATAVSADKSPCEARSTASVVLTSVRSSPLNANPCREADSAARVACTKTTSTAKRPSVTTPTAAVKAVPDARVRNELRGGGGGWDPAVRGGVPLVESGDGRDDVSVEVSIFSIWRVVLRRNLGCCLW